jgi:hypothetical protein
MRIKYKEEIELGVHNKFDEEELSKKYTLN